MAIAYDQIFGSEEEASINVDALVNDMDFEATGRMLMSNQLLEQPRRATPTIPPGFTIPVPKAFPEQPSRPASCNTSASVTPAVPVVPATPIRVATPSKLKTGKHTSDVAETRRKDVSVPTTTNTKPKTSSKSDKRASSAKSPGRSENLTKPDAQSTTTEQKGEKSIASGLVEQKGLEKATSRSKATEKRYSSADASTSSRKESDIPVEAIPSTKRQHPGKLDIAAATTLTDNEQSFTGSSMKTIDAQSKSLRTVSMASASSVPDSPAATSTGSPVKRSTAPRTLRVVPTPKSEHLPPLSAASATSLPHVPTVDKLRSRQASIASINIPGTPASELISDNASVTSTSMSRANSPPPIGAKVGSAPMRKKTKSQLKKERQERARHIAEEQAVAIDEHTRSEPEPEQAPILGRKKKAKKPGVGSSKSTPAVLKPEPSSPKQATVEEEEAKAKAKPTPPATSKKSRVAKSPLSSPRKAQASPGLEPTSTPDITQDKSNPTAQSIIADLQRTGELLVSTLEFFKPLSASLAHSSRTSQQGATTAPPDLKFHISEADLADLAKKKPVRLKNQKGKSDSNTLITPQGKFFWGLTQELEEKALSLEKHIEGLKNSARFHPRKQGPHSHGHNISAHEQSKDVLPAIATALKEAGAKLSKSTGSSGQLMPKLDPTSTLLGSSTLPLPPVQAPADPATSMPWLDLNKSLNKTLDTDNLPPVSTAQSQSQPQPQPQAQTPADAIAYLNQFVLPKTDNPPPSTPRTEMAAVGGPPGAGIGNMPVNVNKIAKAAKVVAEGGTLGNELEGMGVMAADLLGGVVVQGLEALVGAGLGFHSNQGLSVDNQGNIALGGNGVDVQGLVNAIETGDGPGAFGGNMTANASRRNRRSVLSVDEAEQAMLAARKDHEALEKRLGGLMKRNKKLVGSAGKAET